MRAGRSLLVGFLVLASVAVFGVPGASAATSPPTLGRWFGAEGGWSETACFAFGTGCPGFLGVSSFGGVIGAQETHKTFQDLDLVTRPWPARTGNYFYMANVPGGLPGIAYISTTGSNTGPVRPGTMSFALRVHNLPLQPVVIYKHQGLFPSQVPAVTLTLAPDGRILLSTGDSFVGATRPISTFAWHDVTITYGAQRNSAIKLYVDDQPILAGILTLAAPSGDLDLGIVTPTNTPFTLGIDDFVESPSFDAPIHGARINYLMPLGQGNVSWTKSYPISECRDAAANWQLVAEDQWITAPTSNGKTVSCNLGGSSVATDRNQIVDEYTTEGIPSRHVPSSIYHRNLTTQPNGGDVIAGVRLRMRAVTDGPLLPLGAGYIDGGQVQEDQLTFQGQTGSSQVRWGPNHALRPNGQAWTAAALAGVGLRINSGPGLGAVPVWRSVYSIRLDYVWIP